MKSPEAEFERAVNAFQTGRYRKARDILTKLERNVGAQPVITHLMGFVLLEEGKPESAIPYLREATKLFPTDVNVFNALGVAQRRVGDLTAAQATLVHAQQLSPNDPSTFKNLGNVLSDAGAREEAINAFRRAFALAPDDEETASALASEFVRAGLRDDAITLLRDMIRNTGGSYDLLMQLGRMATLAAQPDEAKHCFDQALTLKPEDADALSAKISTLVLLGDVERAIEIAESNSARSKKSRALGVARLFALNYWPDTTPEKLRQVAEAIPPRLKLKKGPPHIQTMPSTLKVGLISERFRTHPVSFMTRPFLEGVNHDDMDVTVFGVNVPIDADSQAIQKAADNWIDLTGMSDDAMVERIREQKLDVMISPSGLEEQELLDLFQGQLAPVQLTAFGVFLTSGAKSIDGLVSDWHHTPQGSEIGYTEQLIRMPDGYAPFDPSGEVPALTDPLDGPVIFGSFNTLQKLSDNTLALWSKVLDAVPGSKLKIKTHSLGAAGCRQSLVAKAAENGIEEARLILESGGTRRSILDAYNGIDIALDPLSYSGGITTLEALWMGVPVVTLPGQTFVRRHSFSHLSVAGLTDWIARDQDHYIAIAAQLADEIRKTPNFGRNLRSTIQQSPTSDGVRWASDFNQAIRNFMG